MSENTYNLRKRKNEMKISINLEKSQENEIIRLMDILQQKNELIRKISKEKSMLLQQLHDKKVEIESLQTEITILNYVLNIDN